MSVAVVSRMDSGYYAAFTGLMARMQALDVVANNLANTSTTGFRGQHKFYEAVAANSNAYPVSPLNAAVNDYGVLGGLNVDFRQGTLQTTGNPLDLAMRGPGFFAIQTARGVRYTRNGTFHENTASQLVNEDGDLVLGAGGPIQLPTGDVAVGSDGTVAVNGAGAGQIRLAEFKPGTELTPEGATNFIAPANSEQAAATSSVESGMLEQSNLSPVQETISLVQLQRHSEMLERTLSIFLDDFNRTAVQDLARD